MESLHAFKKLISEMDKETLNDIIEALPKDSHNLSIEDYNNMCWNIVPIEQKGNISFEDFCEFMENFRMKRKNKLLVLGEHLFDMLRKWTCEKYHAEIIINTQLYFLRMDDYNNSDIIQILEHAHHIATQEKPHPYSSEILVILNYEITKLKG